MENLDRRKRKIIKMVLESGEASIAEIQHSTGIPRSSLNHHLGQLWRRDVVIQQRAGREVLNRLNPKHIQKFRKEFKVEAPKLLITGYTFDPDRPDEKTLQMLERAIKFLSGAGIKIEKSTAFTTPSAREKIRDKGYTRGDKEIAMEIEVYQNDMHEVEKHMREIIERELMEREIIIDLTPLTKLFTITGLSMAREYSLKTFYHAGKKLIWV